MKGVPLRVFRVPEDIVVLGRPAFFSTRAVIVGPDNLVLKAFTPEDFVQHHLGVVHFAVVDVEEERSCGCEHAMSLDRKSTRLNSSHPSISYAVFCLKKKKKKKTQSRT